MNNLAVTLTHFSVTTSGAFMNIICSKFNGVDIFPQTTLFHPYVGGRYCHQTSTLFTIITKQIHNRQTKKKKGETEEDNNLHRNIQKRRINNRSNIKLLN